MSHHYYMSCLSVHSYNTNISMLMVIWSPEFPLCLLNIEWSYIHLHYSSEHNKLADGRDKLQMTKPSFWNLKNKFVLCVCMYNFILLVQLFTLVISLFCVIQYRFYQYSNYNVLFILFIFITIIFYINVINNHNTVCPQKTILILIKVHT